MLSIFRQTMITVMLTITALIVHAAALGISRAETPLLSVVARNGATEVMGQNRFNFFPALQSVASVAVENPLNAVFPADSVRHDATRLPREARSEVEQFLQDIQNFRSGDPQAYTDETSLSAQSSSDKARLLSRADRR